MSYSIERAEIDRRLLEVKALLSHVRTHESPETPPQDAEEVKIMRGLFYVHLYSVYEKSINECISSYLTALAGIGMSIPEIEPILWPVVLDKYFRALHTLPSDSNWKKRSEFVASYRASEPCAINDSLFEMQLQSASPETLDNVRAYLGVSPPAFDGADKLAIKEIVSKRHEVAHGRSSPARVGASVRSANLESRLNSVENYIEKLSVALEDEFRSLSYVKAEFKARYLPVVS